MVFSGSSPSSGAAPSAPAAATAAAAPRAEEIAAGARRLADELAAFLDQHPSLQTASTAQAKSDIPELQLVTCRKLREVGSVLYTIVLFCSVSLLFGLIAIKQSESYLQKFEIQSIFGFHSCCLSAKNCCKRHKKRDGFPFYCHG